MACKIEKNKNGKINKVLDKNGEASQLFQKILNVPTLSLLDAINVYKNAFNKNYGIANEENSSARQGGEAEATFNNFQSYSEAVKNTPIGEKIKIDLDGETVAKIDNVGDINDLIRQDIISGERELTPSGDVVVKMVGGSLAKRIVNASIAKSIIRGRLNEEGNIVERESRELTPVSTNFQKNTKTFGEEGATTILASKLLSEGTPAFGKERIVNYREEVASENVLMEKLKNLMSDLGVTTMSLEAWEKKVGEKALSHSLADIGNRIMAFASGKATQDTLSEEAIHFIVEALPQDQVKPLLEMIHKTSEWKQYAQQYMEIYQNEDTVRREILGKVLKNSLQEKYEQETLQGQSVVRRLLNLLNNFIEGVRTVFKPEHQVRLDNIKEEIYKKLMADELYNDLLPEQFSGNKLVLYQTENTPLYNSLSKALESFKRLDKQTGGNSQYKLDDIKLQEAELLKAAVGIASTAKTHVAHLNKRGKQEGFLSSEETFVYVTIERELKPALELAASLVREETTEEARKALKEIEAALNQISVLSGDLKAEQKNSFKKAVEKAVREAGLTDAMSDVLLKEMQTLDRDTNQFYAMYGGLAHAQNPILNVLSTVMGDMNREANLQFTKRQNDYLNTLNDLGFKDEDVAKALKDFKDGYHLLSPYDHQALALEEAKIKTEIHNSLVEASSHVTVEQMLKSEGDIKLRLSQEQVKRFSEQVLEGVRKSGLYLDVLTKPEREKIEDLTKDFSARTKNFMNQLSSRKRNVFKRALDNKGMSSEDNYELQQIMREQQLLASPYTSEGDLLDGLVIGEDGEIILSKPLKDLSEQARTAYEMNYYNLARQKDFSNDTTKSSPTKFINTLLSKGKNEKIDFIRLNSRISYTKDFWDLFNTDGSLADKLRDGGETELADNIQTKRRKLNNLLKQFRDYNNPSQINYEDMSESQKQTVKSISEDLEGLYKQVKAEFKGEKGEPFSETTTNKAYEQAIKDNGLISLDNKLNFIYSHVTSSSKDSMQRAISNYRKFNRGEMNTLPKAFTNFNKGSEEENILEYAESKLLPYFKELKPLDFNIDLFVTELAGIKNEAEYADLLERNNYISFSPAYIWLDAESSDRLNPEYTKRRESGEPLINFEYKGGLLKNKKYIEKFFNNAKEFKDFDSLPTKGLENLKVKGSEKTTNKEYELLRATIEFQEESIKSAGMEGKHSKYQLPQFRRQGMARRQQLIENFSLKNLKESIKDIVTVREDDPILGQTIDGQDAKNFQAGALSVPRMGFRKLEDSEEVTDEILYSTMLMAKEAEKRKQRVGALSTIESIRTEIQGKQYGDKAGESTTTYKMFDDFVRYNVYGQTETFTWETDFFGLTSKKHNIAPLINQFQGWVRLVNLGFSVLTPMTSLLQGSTNFLVEKFVGDRLDRQAAKEARKKVPKLVTEATAEFLDVRAKGELNLIMQYFGLESPLERFKNSNYGKVLRGASLDKSAYFTHFMGDIALTAQTVMTVLHDFKNVNGSLLNYSEWRNRNRTMTEKEARAEWTKNTQTAYSYLEKSKDGQISMNDKFFQDIKNAPDRLSFLKNRIQIAKQEIDNQISQEDKGMIQRHAIFSFFSLHKGFLISSMTKRMKQRHLNLYTGQMEEGTFNGTLKFLVGMAKDIKKDGLKNAWKNNFSDYAGGYTKQEENGKFYIVPETAKSKADWLTYESEAEQENAFKEITAQNNRMRKVSVKRAMADLAFANTLALLALLFKDMADDDEDDYGKEFLAYATYRLATEVGGQSVGLPAQGYSFLESPSTGLSQIQNALDIMDLGSDDKVTNGNYRGMTERQAWVYKALPLAKEYNKVKNIDRTRKSFEFHNHHYIDNFTFIGMVAE